MSNEFTKYIVNLVIIVISILIILNLLSFYTSNYYNDKNILLETKTSKLLRLGTLDTLPDVIFIGSSRTQNHIDTNSLSVNGISAYNFGLPGKHWDDHDIVIQKAVEYVNKAIVVSINAEDLFRDVDCPFDPLIHRVFMDTFKECNVFSAIVPNIGNILEAANKVYNKNLDGRKKTILEYYGVELDDLGNKINYIRGVKDRYVVFYQNGDSVVFSKRTSQHLKRDPDQQLTTHNYLDKKFNNNAIKYMQYLEDIIIKSGKKALFIIEPTSYNDTFLVDVSLLKKYIKSDIVDNTNFFFGDFNFWSDKKHLNYLGRGYYTSLIKRQLLDIL